MKKNILITALTACFVLAVSGMAGCKGKDEKANSAQTAEATAEKPSEETDEGKGDLITDEEQFAEDVDQQVDTEIETETETETVLDSSGEYGVYDDKVNELRSEGLADMFELVNIDEDDSPELVASDSKGSFDHENAFIFTFYNNEVTELAAVITGVDGGNLDFAERKNLIHISGAAAGMREVFSQIKDGKLEEVFAAEAAFTDDDGEYSVNGENVKEDEYYEKINTFVKPYNPLTRISYEGFNEITFSM